MKSKTFGVGFKPTATGNLHAALRRIDLLVIDPTSETSRTRLCEFLGVREPANELLRSYGQTAVPFT